MLDIKMPYDKSNGTSSQSLCDSKKFVKAV